tara:strand:- start:528 stop:743 length:216 start_codon:yes stop_codon:yes gene_type:complete
MMYCNPTTGALLYHLFRPDIGIPVPVIIAKDWFARMDCTIKRLIKKYRENREDALNLMAVSFSLNLLSIIF